MCLPSLRSLRPHSMPWGLPLFLLVSVASKGKSGVVLFEKTTKQLGKPLITGGPRFHPSLYFGKEIEKNLGQKESSFQVCFSFFFFLFMFFFCLGISFLRVNFFAATPLYVFLFFAFEKTFFFDFPQKSCKKYWTECRTIFHQTASGYHHVPME